MRVVWMQVYPSADGERIDVFRCPAKFCTVRACLWPLPRCVSVHLLGWIAELLLRVCAEFRDGLRPRSQERLGERAVRPVS